MNDKPSESSPAEPAEAPSSDPKDKFRAALERKRGQQAARANDAHAESKIHGEHGAAGGRRTFRRKSG